MTTIHRSAIVPYSAHQMFELVADIPSYPKFLPWCGGARINSTQGDEVIAAIDIATAACTGPSPRAICCNATR